jgi:hypothetical protein
MNIESIVKRYELLASKIVSAGYISKFGKFDKETKEYDTSAIPKTGDLIQFEYFNDFSGKYYKNTVDVNGALRDNDEIDSSQSCVKLEELITNENFVRGQKGNILRNICLSLFNEDSIAFDYTPKEVMNTIESMSNGNITFSGTDDSSKVYINPGTFRKIFYNAKKEAAADLTEYKSIILISNDIISQKGVADKMPLKYDLLKESDLESFFVSPFAAKKYPEFSSLKKYESLKYSDISHELTDVMPSRTFRRIIKNVENEEYKELVKSNKQNSELFTKIMSENPEELSFDPLEKFRYVPSFGLINNVGNIMGSLLGYDDNSKSMVISGAIIEELANCENPHTPLNLKNIENIVSDNEFSEMYSEIFNDYLMKEAQKNFM